MGSPVRILHVVVNMNRGGAETLIMNLYRNIDRSKVQFDFLTCKVGEFDSEIKKLGGRIFRIPYVSEVGHGKYINSLDRFFTSHNEYKIVHSHMDKMSGFVLRSANNAGIPIKIAHSHSTKSQGSIFAKLYKWYAGKYILTNSTHLIACSEKSAQWMFKEKADQTIILKNAVDIRKFQYTVNQKDLIRKKLNIKPNTLVIGHVGRFDYPKNHRFLIKILNNIVNKNQDTVLLLIGDGKLKSIIEKKVSKLNLQDHVKFLGVRTDVESLLHAMDIFVFPSIYEGLPVTLIEAQAAGLPCLVSDKVTKEVTMNSNSIEFLPLNNIKKWVDSINDRRNIVRVKANELTSFNEDYDISNVANSTQEMYLSVAR
jgi:glycosyltransferase involved in cell wall biosynthesis